MGSGGGGRLRSPGCHRPRHAGGKKDAFILGFARFQVGCSARFNDLQHVHPKDLIYTSNTVELTAWQTKTVSAARINRNPVPLIAAPTWCPAPASWLRGSMNGHVSILQLAPVTQDLQARLRRARLARRVIPLVAPPNHWLPPGLPEGGASP